MNDFAEKVFEIVRCIPRGKVLTYGAVAAHAGKPAAARAVGTVLRRNPDSRINPCHRVVFSGGRLTDGYVFGGKDEQKRLLEDEGVRFLQNGYVDMKECFFNYE